MTFLDRVCAEAIERVAAAERIEPLDELRDRAWATPSPPAFARALTDGGIIAEVKRASPSRGVLAEDRDAVAQAQAYVDGGAAAVSVLTEPTHFRGSLDELAAVACAIEAPVLRKDFVLTGYQLFEARAAGAAAALLLVAALDDSRLTELLATAREAGIDVLIETHDAAEIARASEVLAGLARDQPWVVGINARDLTHLSVDRDRFATFAGMLPENVIVVAESGVGGPDDVEEYRRGGADAVLVGEHLMVADDPVTATRALVAAARRSPATSTQPDPT